MADKRPQNYKNHARFVPLYHFVTSLILVVFLIFAIYRLVRTPSLGGAMTVLLAAALALMFYYLRVFPLAVQDRLIRLEERLRLVEVLPADLKGRVRELSSSQLIGLRFAGDDELDRLVRETLENNLSRDDIKKRIKNWRPDYERC